MLLLVVMAANQSKLELYKCLMLTTITAVLILTIWRLEHHRLAVRIEGDIWIDGVTGFNFAEPLPVTVKNDSLDPVVVEIER